MKNNNNNTLNKAHQDLQKEEKDCLMAIMGYRTIKENGSAEHYALLLYKSIVSNMSNMNSRYKNIGLQWLKGVSSVDIAKKENVSVERVNAILSTTFVRVGAVGLQLQLQQETIDNLYKKIDLLEESCRDLVVLKKIKLDDYRTLTHLETKQHRSFDDGWFDLSVRALNVLKSYEIKSPYELSLKSEKEVKEMRNLGRGTFIELKELLHDLKLNFNN